MYKQRDASMLDEKHVHLLQNISSLILLVSLCSIVMH